MTSGISPTATAATSGAAASDSATEQKNLATDPLAQKEVFLRLLVAQIKNQNPMNPADGIEFLSQLAQFSQLEQMLGIRTELETIRKNLPPPAPTEAAATGQDPIEGA